MAVAGCQLLLMGLGGIERKFGGGGGGVRIDFLKSLTTLPTPHSDLSKLIIKPSLTNSASVGFINPNFGNDGA